MSHTLDVITAYSDPKESTKVTFKKEEPISSLIERIKAAQCAQVIPITRHDLFINGTRLTDHTKTLGHYRILGRILTYRAVKASTQDQKKMSINITTPTGHIIPLTCYADTCIDKVKEMIQDKEGISADEQSLFHVNRQLADFRDLKFYGLSEGSSLQLVMPLPTNGAHPGIVFVDGMPDYHGLRKIRFSQGAPRGRVASTGVNVECLCKCTPTHRVIVQKGLGIFEITKTTLICPNCGQSDKITPISFGYLKCKYRFHALAAHEGRQLSTAWIKVATDNCYDLVPDTMGQISIFRRWVVEAVGLNEWDPCTICLHPLALPVTLACGHQFHPGCKKLWNGFCPNCEHNKCLITDAVCRI
ncbi:hypothetical protein BG015_000454 [Linnemannia schmuckeri]|uniref:RING-type domain-containing protein n=1 Tax=Linnemannia schmuckeri TaxID=64567 RepID=A0A9P5V736_9FUNG|nr:hypothetical protein BG015_000454 [Linnemannia schmuckeri]